MKKRNIYRSLSSMILALTLSVSLIGCDEDGNVNPNVDIQAFMLSNDLSYSALGTMVDEQKIYFINNNGEEDRFVYEISLDYSTLTGATVTPDDVYLRAEKMVDVGFKGHIAASIDDKYIVALENGGPNIAVIEIATKKVTKYNKPSNNVTQVGFNVEGELFAAAGNTFYQVENWKSDTATFKELKYDGLPTVTGGDLLFLDDKRRKSSFLSFSRGNSENDGDGAYLIDIIEEDTNGNATKVNYQKVFELAPKVTGACVVGVNHFITTHHNNSKATVYGPKGEELFQIKIKTKEGKEFVAGAGDLASVNNLDQLFFDDHIDNGIIYLSSAEERKIYEIDLDNGANKEIKNNVNTHFGLSDDIIYYTQSGTIRSWNLKTDVDELLKSGFGGEKVVVYNNQVWIMNNNKLKVLDIASKEYIHEQSYPEIKSGGDLLISKDQKHLLVFDRTLKKVHEVLLSDYSYVTSHELPVKEANGAAYNKDGTYIVSSEGHLYILNDKFELLGEKLLGFTQDNGDMASTYYNFSTAAE